MCYPPTQHREHVNASHAQCVTIACLPPHDGPKATLYTLLISCRTNVSFHKTLVHCFKHQDQDDPVDASSPSFLDLSKLEPSKSLVGTLLHGAITGARRRPTPVEKLVDWGSLKLSWRVRFFAHPGNLSCIHGGAPADHNLVFNI